MSQLTEYKNNFTKDLDNFLREDIKAVASWFDEDISYTYLWKDDVTKARFGISNSIAFRALGATRGHIEVNKNMIITDIKFYKDACDIYEGDYESFLKEKYIGTRLE